MTRQNGRSQTTCSVTGDALAVDHRAVEAEGRLAVAPRRALEQFAGGRDGPSVRGVREWIERVLEEKLGGVRKPHAPD